MVHSADNIHRSVGHLCTEQAETAHRFQVPQVFNAAIGDAYAGEIELFEIRQPCNKLQSLVGYERIAQQKAPQVFQTRNAFHTFVGEWIVTEVQIFELRKLREVD